MDEQRTATYSCTYAGLRQSLGTAVLRGHAHVRHRLQVHQWCTADDRNMPELLCFKRSGRKRPLLCAAPETRL